MNEILYCCRPSVVQAIMTRKSDENQLEVGKGVSLRPSIYNYFI